MNNEKNRLIKNWKESKIVNSKFIKAFKKLDKEKFVPKYLQFYSYKEFPLYLGQGQSLNGPTTIANMIHVLNPKKGDWVLEIGTGTGYTTALLSLMVGKEGKVFSFEKIKDFYFMAKDNLSNFNNVNLFLGDGIKNISFPVDLIIISFPLEEIPFFMFENLNVGAVMVVFVGNFIQDLIKITKISKNKYKKEIFGEFRL